MADITAKSGEARVIVLQHAAPENLGTIADALAAAEATPAYVRSHGGQTVPAEVGDAVGLIVLVGPMSVDEDQVYPFLRAERRLIESALRERRPVLGVCLGSQLLASVLGAEVSRGPEKEIGWLPVRLTTEAATDPLWRDVGPEFTAFHWHGDVFSPPRGGVLLAGSALTAHQAFRHGANAYGLLFHLEATEELVSGMVDAFGGELVEVNREAGEITTANSRHLPALQQIAGTVFARWAELLSE